MNEISDFFIASLELDRYNLYLIDKISAESSTYLQFEKTNESTCITKIPVSLSQNRAKY